MSDELRLGECAKFFAVADQKGLPVEPAAACLVRLHPGRAWARVHL